VTLPSDSVDWEVELVVVIGERAETCRRKRHGSMSRASPRARTVRARCPARRPGPAILPRQVLPRFQPIGPTIVTPDEFVDPDDLALTCSVDGEVLQAGRTKDLIFSVPALISYLSSILPLLPGDIIFTGTPAASAWAVTRSGI